MISLFISFILILITVPGTWGYWQYKSLAFQKKRITPDYSLINELERVCDISPQLDDGRYDRYLTALTHNQLIKPTDKFPDVPSNQSYVAWVNSDGGVEHRETLTGTFGNVRYDPLSQKYLYNYKGPRLEARFNRFFTFDHLAICYKGIIVGKMGPTSRDKHIIPGDRHLVTLTDLTVQ